MKKTWLLYCFFITSLIEAIELLPFKKVVIWGHKLHSHTHSYIHDAFYKAFRHLGYETLWLDNEDSIEGIDFSETLFLTEGQVDQKMPLIDGCFYILHNCDSPRYQELLAQKRALILQVYTHDCKKRPVEKWGECIYFETHEHRLYMPWATDLLPHEIDQQKKYLRRPTSNKVIFIGSINEGGFGNFAQVVPFFEAAKDAGIQSETFMQLDCADARHKIRESLYAPAIQGEWQVRVGYIPCRIFKNISYGKMGITNSATVYKLFHKKIVYHPDTRQLFYEAHKKLKNLSRKEIKKLMDFVKDNHTYLNRIDMLFKAIKLIRDEQ